ncbi:MAG: M20/M25/M40 family metallo-hydrolase [Flavobacteriaceae bacterium]|nr:M20/M25/M40 family metallo-hydrolase [Flavobacteriaceae bacterium]
MKKSLKIMLIVLFAVSCKNDTKVELNKLKISEADIKAVVEYLASDDMEGRAVGSKGIDKAANFIEKEFESYGVKPYFKTYRNEFKVDSLDAFNVVGFLPGNDGKLKNELVILGAHYDHIGFNAKSVENDAIANGANDNASGTATVLAMANYFAQTKSNKRSILFALFSAEEVGLKGSSHLANHLRNEKMDMYTMLNFEMLGVPLKDKKYEVFLTGYDKSNLAKKMNDYSNSNSIGDSDIARKQNLFKRSDNYPFYRAMEIPSHTISACDLSNFEYYHHVKDEVSQINFDFLTNIINKLIPAVEKITQTATQEIKLSNE